MTYYLDKRWMLLGVPPAIILVFAEVLAAALANTQVSAPSVGECCNAKFTVWSEAALRLQIISIYFVFLATFLATIVRVLLDVWGIYRGRPPALLLIPIGLATALAIALSTLSRTTRLSADVGYFGEALFLRAASEGAKSAGNLWDANSIFFILDVYKISLNLAAILIPIAVISCLVRPVAANGLGAAEDWTLRSGRLRMVLYFSTITLALGTLFVRSWASYPSFLLDKTALDAYLALVNAFTTFGGIEYSLALASVVLPVGWLLNREAHEISKNLSGPGASKSEIEATSKKNGLTISSSETFKGFAALMAPLITGAFSSLTSAIA